MSEDEKLVEKVAEAMWNAAWPRSKWVDLGENQPDAYRIAARAAIACVREHDKLVHANATGAERSTIPPDVIAHLNWIGSYVAVANNRNWRDILDRVEHQIGMAQRDVDRTVSVQAIEPILSSLLLKKTPKGGIAG